MFRFNLFQCIRGFYTIVYDEGYLKIKQNRSEFRREIKEMGLFRANIKFLGLNKVKPKICKQKSKNACTPIKIRCV